MSSHLARLEALLFVAGEDGLSLRAMAQLLEMPVTGLTQSLEKLQAKYEADEDSVIFSEELLSDTSQPHSP